MEVSRSNRLLLRALEPADRSEILEMHDAGRGVGRWSPPLPPGTSFDQMVDRWLSDDPMRDVRLVTERLDEDGGPRLANIIGLTDIVRGVFQNAFVGWKTHPDLLRRGYCTEAVQLALQYAFAATGLKLHRVQAAILPDNVASCRVAEKCGFRLEGVAQRYLHVREQWRDHLMYAVTVEELSPKKTVSAPIAEYWERFLQAQAWTGALPAMFDAFQFGDTSDLADELAALVLQGVKTATCESLFAYKGAGATIPPVGAHCVVLDGKHRPVAVIQTVEVALRAFDQVDAQFAFDEGEGDQSLDYWRSVHQAYFVRTLPKYNREFSRDMPLICERFKVVWKA